MPCRIPYENATRTEVRILPIIFYYAILCNKYKLFTFSNEQNTNTDVNVDLEHTLFFTMVQLFPYHFGSGFTTMTKMLRQASQKLSSELNRQMAEKGRFTLNLVPIRFSEGSLFRRVIIPKIL